MTRKPATRKAKEQTGGQAGQAPSALLMFYAVPGRDLVELPLPVTWSHWFDNFLGRVRVWVKDTWDNMPGEQRPGHLILEAGTTYSRAIIPAEISGEVERQLSTCLKRVILGNLEGELVKCGACFFRVSFRAVPLAKTLEKINNGTALVDESLGQGEPVPSPKERIKELFAGLPEDAEGRLAASIELNSDFRREAAAQLQPVIKTLLQDAPPVSYAEKQALAKKINEALHEVGLAIRHPDTKEPCGVVATTNRPSSKHSWLRLQPRGGGRQSQPTTELPPLELMEAARKEKLAQRWREVVAREESGSSPRRS